jgi:hypothetical protein
MLVHEHHERHHEQGTHHTGHQEQQQAAAGQSAAQCHAEHRADLLRESGQARDLAALFLGQAVRGRDHQVRQDCPPAELGEDPAGAEHRDAGGARHDQQRDHADDGPGDHPGAAAAEPAAGAVTEHAEERGGQQRNQSPGAGDVAEVLLVPRRQLPDPDSKRDGDGCDESDEDTELGGDHQPDVGVADLRQRRPGVVVFVWWWHSGYRLVAGSEGHGRASVETGLVRQITSAH